MSSIKNTIKTSWKWFYERTPLWIIAFLGVSFMMSLNDLSIQSSKIEKDTLECKINCQPNAYEYIADSQTNNCWCYENTQTLVLPTK